MPGAAGDADLILHAGDIVDAGTLAETRGDRPAGGGRGRQHGPEELRRRLPETRIVDAGRARIAMVHDGGPATGRLERMRKRFPDADAVVFGHSHMPGAREEDGFQIFNPGSPTDRRAQPKAHDGRGAVEDGRIEFELLVATNS